MQPDITNVESVRSLVDTFYLRAANDELLKPVFYGLVNSGSHKEKLYEYWSGAILGGTADAQGFPRHIELMFSRQHFIRWLTIFLETINALYSGPNAEKAKVIIIRKGEQFQSGLEISGF
jgi:hemoglobin